MEWQQYYDQETGHYYYHNSKTQETTWTAPEKFEPFVNTDEKDFEQNIQTEAPVSIKYDWGERQMGHYFNVDEYRQRVQEPTKKVQKKLTKKQVAEFKKKKAEKKRKKKQWLFE